MANRKTRRKRIGGWGQGHVSQLAHGWDFHGDGWGVSKLAVERADLPTAIIDDMRAAWIHFREDILTSWAARPRVHPRPWAARFFEPEGEADSPVDGPARELVEV